MGTVAIYGLGLWAARLANRLRRRRRSPAPPSISLSLAFHPLLRWPGPGEAFNLFLPPMNSRRDFRSHRAALFDGIEEGAIRSSAYSSQIHDHENDQAMDSLHDRVSVLKRLTGDIHEEVENHNRMLDRMGNDMDASRGFLSGTVDKFKMVFETKASRRMATMVASFIAVFFLIYYLTK
uniref:t-SNARE coiled-coil homology domain-containing protein n=1 Tax=Oryza meridionalis TaxID=40149 RepID=A0A0E0EP49_9ORYZ